MPPAEKKILGSEDLKESEAKISLNTTVENHVQAPETSELKFVEGLQVDNTVSTTNQLANLSQETANLNLPETAALTAENPGKNSLNLAEKPANPAPAVTEQVSVAPTQNSQTPAEVTEKTSVIPAPNPAPVIAQTETSTSENLAEIENSASLEPAATNSQTSESSELQQVTSVSQLSDVRPTDWAFQALQSLVERYGCIAGYPDGTFRGNRAMTRYEFAAGLNACLDKVSELIQGGSRNLVTREDLASVQRLQEEFAAELATLRGRVDALEARASELEANQFSTTTKLNGEVIFGLAGIARGDDAEGRKADKTTAFGSRVRLNFDTSFSGKDLLRTRLQVLNLGSFSTNNTKTAEGELRFHAGPFAEASNTVGLDALLYQFPLGKSTTVI